jgi:alpha-beta hydrolase superfamily lysophospholipase
MVIFAVLLVLLLLILFIGLPSWFAFTSLRARDPRVQAEIRILGMTEETVTLPRLKKTATRGISGLAWDSGFAVLGDITALSRQTVTRQIVKTTHLLSAGQFVCWNKFVYRGDPQEAHGQAYEEVHIHGSLGALPAWLVPGKRTTWVLCVHGFHATREEALRILPALVSLGFPVLVLTYRNDAGAPKSPDHLYHLGDTEWEDVEAGVVYALSHGAQDIVLVGWSMGGCLVETFLHRSSYAGYVQALVLDSPILNWQRVLEAQVQAMHLPSWFRVLFRWLMTRLIHIDFAVFNYELPTGERAIPTLLFHGVADVQVPVEGSDLYAQARPDVVMYRRVEGAGHTLIWNADPHTYEEALSLFLQRVIHRQR